MQQLKQVNYSNIYTKKKKKKNIVYILLKQKKSKEKKTKYLFYYGLVKLNTYDFGIQCAQSIRTHVYNIDVIWIAQCVVLYRIVICVCMNNHRV